MTYTIKTEIHCVMKESHTTYSRHFEGKNYSECERKLFRYLDRLNAPRDYAFGYKIVEQGSEKNNTNLQGIN